MKKINKITDKELLKEVTNLFLEASKFGATSLIEYCLEKGADVHARDNCALRGASRNGHKETVALLLEKGADVHADNNLALRWASSYYGHKEVVALLLEKGADVHADNNLAIQWASENGHKEVVEILKAYMNKSKN